MSKYRKTRHGLWFSINTIYFLLVVICFIYLRIHGMLFKHPVDSGDTIGLASQIIYAGKSSVGVYTKVYIEATKEFVVDAFLTFVRADAVTHKATSHGLTVEIDTDEATELQARYLKEKSDCSNHSFLCCILN